MSYTIVVIDDEKNIRRSLAMVLEGEGYNVLLAENAGQGLKIISEEVVDLIALDVRLPDINGIEVLKKLKETKGPQSDIPVVMISGHATLEEAVKAVKIGAEDFFEKPLDRERILIVFHNILEKYQIKQELKHLKKEIENRYEMVGKSRAMLELFEQIEKVAPTKGRVFITGESGTGKEHIARAIHKLSPRASKQFIKLNCAAIPAELIESELFGYEKGAFTGADGSKKGLFELADHGTLFLDEIGDMSFATQAKLLRALQSGEINRVGSEKVITVDVRILAATNKNIQQLVNEGKFREDLYYRLNVIPITTPPLRERIEDIPFLISSFMNKFCKENGVKPKEIDEEAILRLQKYYWPGNVRELKNIIERLIIMSGDKIYVKDLPDYIRYYGLNKDESNEILQYLYEEAKDKLTLKEFRETSEKFFILNTLDKSDWNVSQAAQVLGVERTNLHKKIKSYNIKK